MQWDRERIEIAELQGFGLPDEALLGLDHSPLQNYRLWQLLQDKELIEGPSQYLGLHLACYCLDHSVKYLKDILPETVVEQIHGCALQA